MADENQEIVAYLNGHGSGHTLFFTIFPDWTPEDYEEVCSRIREVLTELGTSLNGRLSRIPVKGGRVSLNAHYRQRIAAENVLFERYNQDGLLLLPHQKDSSKPRPVWYEKSMLIPGSHSIGQKLIVVCYRKISRKVLHSMGLPAGQEKELFFFPAVTKEPYSIRDEEELLGRIQHLYKQGAKEGPTRSISLFVASKSTLDTMSLC